MPTFLACQHALSAMIIPSRLRSAKAWRVAAAMQGILVLQEIVQHALLVPSRIRPVLQIALHVILGRTLCPQVRLTFLLAFVVQTTPFLLLAAKACSTAAATRAFLETKLFAFHVILANTNLFSEILIASHVRKVCMQRHLAWHFAEVVPFIHTPCLEARVWLNASATQGTHKQVTCTAIRCLLRHVSQRPIALVVSRELTRVQTGQNRVPSAKEAHTQIFLQLLQRHSAVRVLRTQCLALVVAPSLIAFVTLVIAV